MNNVLSFVILAAGVLISAGIVVITLSIAGQEGRRAERATQEVAQLLSFEEAEFSTDLKGEIAGSTLKELLVKYNDAGYYTLTVTKEKPTGFYGPENTDSSSTDHYVKDDSVFSSRLVRNKNDLIIGIQFVEDGLDQVDFDVSAAKAAQDTVESRLQKAQYKLFTKVNKNNELCRECVKAFAAWSDSLKSLSKASFDLAYRQTDDDITGETSADEDAIALAAVKRKQAEFYNALAGVINDSWLPNNWFDTLLYLTDPDGDLEDDPGYDDKDPGDDDQLDEEEEDPPGDDEEGGFTENGSNEEAVDPGEGGEGGLVDVPDPTPEPTPDPTEEPEEGDEGDEGDDNTGGDDTGGSDTGGSDDDVPIQGP